MKIKTLLIVAGIAGLGLAGCVQDQYGSGYGQFGYSYSGGYNNHTRYGDHRYDGRYDGSRWTGDRTRRW
jgi:hypothetical protein